jgi:DNA-3-methyladenine glycosylase I
VKEKLPAIYEYLGDYRKASGLDPAAMLKDRRVIQNEGKIRGCISNARQFEGIIKRYGSFSGYLKSFGDLDDPRTLDRVKFDFMVRFDYIGKITSYHLMTELGLDVIKPDRVICRIFKRLGFIRDEGDLEGAVDVGRKIALATGQRMRYVDIIFVKYGQKGAEEGFGLEDGVCLKVPRCDKCAVTEYCSFHNKD